MVNFKVAIPSYNRADSLIQLSLKTLLSKNIDPNCIDIFVANEQQYKIYKETVPADMYNELIITEKGKFNAVNHIRRYYKRGQKLLNVDDDVSEIYYGYNGENIPLQDLTAYSKYIFHLMIKNECALCGVKENHNPAYKKHSLTMNHNPIDGYFYWTINNPSKKLDLVCELCEDREFALRNIEVYGNVLLNNEISITDESRKENNDLIRIGTYEDYAKGRYELSKMFPHLVELKPKHKSPRFIYPMTFKKKKGKTIPTVVKKW